MCLFLVYLHRWLSLAHALCSVQAFHILFHILLHVCMSVDFASVKVVIKESYLLTYFTSVNQEERRRDKTPWRPQRSVTDDISRRVTTAVDITPV